MIIILAAFTLFHLVAGVAALGLAMRLLTREEADQWRSMRALLVARLLCWIYPAIAFVGVGAAWRAYDAMSPHAVLLVLSPLLWLLVMGLVFAIVDFADDGVLGNARGRE